MFYNYYYNQLKTMQLTDYQFVFIPKWEIKGHEDYYFTSLKELYNSKTNRIVKQVVKGGYSTGYVIDGKFKTLKKLNPLISKIELNPGIVFQIDRILNPNT